MTLRIRTPSEMMSLEDIPDICPNCGHHITPEFLAENKRYTGKAQIKDLVFVCNRQKCNEPFIAEYIRIETPSEVFYALVRVTPPKVERIEFDEDIENISNAFCDIYRQSLKAECHGLSQIAGPGYRKALEFLIKDYAIRENPNDKDMIESMLLGNVIKSYIKGKVQAIAEKASWLGNDETHYKRKWEEKDIEDLKLAIKCTVSFIQYEISSDRLNNEMKR